MKTAFAAVLLLCLLPLTAQAKPSPYRSVDVFAGDRWLMAQGGTSAADVSRAMGCPPPHCARAKAKRRHGRVTTRHMPSHHIGRYHKMVSTPLPRSRAAALPMDPEQEAAYRVIAELFAAGKITVKPLPSAPRKRMNIFMGFAREIERAAAPVRGRSLVGIVKPLAAKVAQIASLCPGTKVISTIRPGAVVRGSGRPSLHRSGKAVDISGPYGCIYAALKGFPGGVSTDAHRVRHVHVNWDPKGREWGRRFAHWQPGNRHRRYARHHRRHYASVR